MDQPVVLRPRAVECDGSNYKVLRRVLTGTQRMDKRTRRENAGGGDKSRTRRPPHPTTAPHLTARDDKQ
ncbi:hypothetical protein FRC08_009975 [Ceratobasidium sp. 394]|nr:hypothetical protein FRC08_009975 [Ceratobasidium sp. 394]